MLRKIIHAAMAAVPLIGWLTSFDWSLALAAAFSVGSVLVEITRRRWPSLNNSLRCLLPGVFRAPEDTRILGSTWFALGALATLLAFGRDVGGTAVLFLALGDPAAELLGRWKGGGARKSVAGSAGCLATCVLAAVVSACLSGLSLVPLLVGAIAAALAERWHPPPDDNLWIPLLSASVMLFAQQL